MLDPESLDKHPTSSKLRVLQQALKAHFLYCQIPWLSDLGPEIRASVVRFIPEVCHTFSKSFL